MKKLFKNKKNNKQANMKNTETNNQENTDTSLKGKSHEKLADLLKMCQESNDFVSYNHEQSDITFSYYSTIINSEIVHPYIFTFIAEHPISSLQELQKKLPIEGIILTDDVKEIQDKIMTGYILVQYNNDESCYALVPALNLEKREVSAPEIEFSVIGPKEAFVESLDTNINLIRKRIPVPELILKEMVIGDLSKTRIVIAYIKGIADEENVNTVCQRIGDINYDQIIDSSFISQFISDNRNSPFPQLIDTERPDRVAAVISEGKIAILVDGSPHALTGPTTLIEFFSAFEDYFLNWQVASSIRLIRLVAVLFSVLTTPSYVAILTYHYDMIPQDMLNTLVASRSGIPFPPILEALLLEFTIELLREAGARLPTKVGQTIGIVGGIVIGTAAVQAGITSDILLIIIALSALASFTTPVYQMSNTIRLIRFPFIFFAQLLGLVGLAVCTAIIVCHLLRLTSLGRPYIEPVYPLRLKDLKDAFIRLPFSKQHERPVEVRPNDSTRFGSQHVQKKSKDIDE